MHRLFAAVLFLVGFTSWQGIAWAQVASSAQPSSHRGRVPEGRWRARPIPRPVVQRPVQDPGFAFRLGQTVGLQAVPPVTMPPGVGNINSPGVQPLPMQTQPFPNASPFPIPNINSPGSVPDSTAFPQPGRDGHRRGRYGRRDAGAVPVIIYGVPYYYYYPLYTGTVVVTTPTAPMQELPVQQQPMQPQSAPYNGTQSYSAPVSPGPQEKMSQPAPAARRVTLLAFKDHTLIAVTDYWLEGDSLVYETSSGSTTAIPLDRLDLPLTQQLNRERNVPFVLEARP